MQILFLKARSAWPRANECKEWETVNRDLLVILNGFSGNAIDGLKGAGAVICLCGGMLDREMRLDAKEKPVLERFHLYNGYLV